MILRGYIDGLGWDRVWGWAFGADHPELPVNLVVISEGAVLARGFTNAPRPDLTEHLEKEGDYGFLIELASPLRRGKRHVIEVMREEDGTPLQNSPLVLEAAESFDATTRREWHTLLAAADTDEDFEQRMAFLLEETDKLRTNFARRKGGHEGREQRRRLRWASERAADDEEKPRALFLDDSMPDASRDAGSNAVLSHIKALLRLGYDVSFASANLTGDSSALEALGVTVFKRPWVDSIESLLERQQGAFSRVYLHRISIASRYLELARAHQPTARIIFSVADLHHLRIARQGTVERRPELMAFADRVRRQEVAAAWAADGVVTHSQVEAQVLKKFIPSTSIFIVPWAVPLRPVATPFGERAGVAMIAGFGHPPNIDAAHWLVSSIMPEVWRSHPGIKCLLVGSELPPALKALESERVEIVGFVSDLAALFERVRLTIAPLAFGAGIKGKVLQSLAAGIPCVCTPTAAEGFGFAPPLSTLVGVNPDELAALVVKMHEDATANAEAADAGLSFIRSFASEQAVDEALRNALQA